MKIPDKLPRYKDNPPTTACKFCKFFSKAIEYLHKGSDDKIYEFWTCPYTDGCKQAVKITAKQLRQAGK